MHQPSIQPQEAFAELAAITLADHSLDGVMDRIVRLAQQSIPGADEVSVTLVEHGTPGTVAHTGPMALALDEAQYERGYGPCLDCIEIGEPILVRSTREEQRWPGWTARAVEEGTASVLSIPVPLQREVAAALNIFSRDEDAFDESSSEIARTFTAYAGVALANMHLYQAQAQLAEQLQTAMASRAVIEQAKGILMEREGGTPQAAFDVLTRMSQDSQRKLRDVARTVVDETGR